MEGTWGGQEGVQRWGAIASDAFKEESDSLWLWCLWQAPTNLKQETVVSRVRLSTKKGEDKRMTLKWEHSD